MGKETPLPVPGSVGTQPNNPYGVQGSGPPPSHKVWLLNHTGASLGPHSGGLPPMLDGGSHHSQLQTPPGRLRLVRRSQYVSGCESENGPLCPYCKEPHPVWHRSCNMQQKLRPTTLSRKSRREAHQLPRGSRSYTNYH